jgi:Flp pilus assembly protein TadG
MAARDRGEAGSVAVWTVLWLTTLIIILAVVINIGHSMTARGELQNGADASALAGARQLDGRVDQLTPAQTEVDGYAAVHPTDRYSVAANTTWYGAWTPRARPCDQQDVEPDASTQPDLFTAANKFCRVMASDAAAAFRINAVYVQTQRAGSPGSAGGGAIPKVLYPFLGTDQTMTRQASAIAVTGGPVNTPTTVCIPMVIGVGCLTGDGSGGTECDPSGPKDSPGDMYVMGLSSTSVRSAGWSVFSSVNPSDTAVCDYLKTGCQSVSIGDNVAIDIGQGNKFNGGCGGTDPEGTSMSKVCDWFKQYASAGDTVDIPVISESGNMSEACPSTYNGQAYIVGFATVKVLAVNCSTNSGNNTTYDCVQAPGASYCNNATAPCSQYASTKCVLVQHICNHDNGNGSTGGAWTGTSPLKPVLVK